MTPLTEEWVEKAEGDFVVANRERRARNSPNYDAVCFHAQQCAEKYLKARLQEESIPFPMTHNLIALLQLILPVEPTWSEIHSTLVLLSNYAVQYRYPGAVAARADAVAALLHCKTVRQTVRLSLQLPV